MHFANLDRNPQTPAYIFMNQISISSHQVILFPVEYAIAKGETNSHSYQVHRTHHFDSRKEKIYTQLLST